MGYADPNPERDFLIWQENNYAEIYAKNNNRSTVIMASSGCGNREYPTFLAHAFKTYNDITEVYIQSTYWGRFPLAMNPTLDEKDILSLDFFLEKNHSDELIDKWSLGLVQDGGYLHAYTKPSGEDYTNFTYNRSTSPSNQPSIRHAPYIYIKMYHYLQTHLEQQDYFRDIFICDALCKYNNARLYLWNINDRCFIPKATEDFYHPLTSTYITDIDASSYLHSNLGIDIEQQKVDSEHYNYDAHALIAEHYITYLKEHQ
jgi:hypothetical protein